MSRPRRLGPVGRYVAVVSVVCLALGALWWSGAVAPRATLGWNGGGATIQGRAYWQVRELANPGPLAVEVRSVSWAASGLDRPQVRVSDEPADDSIAALQRSQPFEPFVLGAGERRSIVLSGWVICLPGASEARPAGGELTVEVEAPLGGPRTLDDPNAEGAGAVVPCPLPDAG